MNVLDRAADKLGGKVTRDQMNRWCGPRDGSKKPDNDKETD